MNSNLSNITDKLKHLLYDAKFRAIISQSALLLIFSLMIYYAIGNAVYNLESQNKNFGFDFLGTPAGFKLNFSLVEHDEDITYGGIFLISILNTILVSVFGVFFATVFGVTIGIARLSQNWLISRLALVYIEITRNVPLLLHIFFWYFAIFSLLPALKDSFNIGGYFYINNRGLELPAPVYEDGIIYVVIAFILAVVIAFMVKRWAKKKQILTGKQFPSFWFGLAIIILLPLIVYFIAGSPISLIKPELKGFNFVGGIKVVRSLFALTVALSIYTASYIAEIVRSGIIAVDYGQTEAGLSLGLSRARVLSLIVIPQAARVIIPPLTNQYLNLTKNSSLATAIAYQDLVAAFAGTVLNQSGRAIEIIFMTMAVYLTLSLMISFLMNLYNRSIALIER